MMQTPLKEKLFNLSLKSLGLLFCLLLCILLQSSSTHYSPLLRHYLLQEELRSSYQGLWPAAKEGSEVALDALARLAEVNEDEYWLEKAASLDSLYAQLALARLSEAKEQIYWWQQAANNGHGPSQFELSLTVQSTQERIRYLEQAALNEHVPAIIALSKYYYEENDVNNALRWLGKASQYDHTNMFRLAKMLWRQGSYYEATETFKRASIQDPIAKTYSDTLDTTPQQSLSILSETSLPLNEECAQQLQFVANSLDSAVQANDFKAKFEQDARLAKLPICIKPLVWLAKDELSCKLVDHRNMCDLSKIAKRSFSPDYTHLVFFLNEGKAYVQNGVMYLDEADPYSVFVHELAHFVGFVDEYAVSSDLASQYCYESNAPNLLLSSDENFYDDATFKMWQGYHSALLEQNIARTADMPDAQETIIQSSLQVGQSRTCASLDEKSYKPSRKLTFLQYHDTNYIPAIYLMMWQDLLQKHYHSIAVSVAFREQAKLIGNETAAAYWAKF
jgi:hypothetical protein